MDSENSEPISADQRPVGDTAHQHPAESILQTYVREFDRVQREARRIAQSANQALQSAAQAMQSTVRAFQGASSAWANIVQTLQESFKATQGHWEIFLRELPTKIRESLIAVARHGWFLDPNMAFSGFGKLERAFREGNEEMAEEALVSYYRERLPAIRTKLQENHPQRTAILDQAFSAHLRGEYALSTAVFLAQADGMCHELFGTSPFRRRGGKPATADSIAQAGAQGFANELLCLLSCPLPISANETERGKDFTELNRHQVLHGESLDYGTETNSLKAISFLNYVGDYVTKTMRAEASKKASGVSGS